MAPIIRSLLAASSNSVRLQTDKALVDDCVHCGFCLAACPTYTLWGEEADSPRGRIYLLNESLEHGRLAKQTITHFDRCLGCMACVPACPSGVQYDKLILKARSEIESNARRPWKDRLTREVIFATFCHPRRLKVARVMLRLYQQSGLRAVLRRSGWLERLPKAMAAMERLAPEVSPHVDLPVRIPASGQRRGVVGLLTGCIQDAFFSPTNAATARVLAAEGFDVVTPSDQSCCGALSEHAGRTREARNFTRATIDQFLAAEVDALIINSAGCGSAIKDYTDLLADDPIYAEKAHALAQKSYDIAEFLAQKGPVAVRHPLNLKIAYHDACHLANAQGIRSAPRELLRAIPGVELLEIEHGEICCGSAGVYNLLEPDAARELGGRKADDVRRADPDLLVAGNPGCLLQIDATLKASGQALPFAHTIEVLDASLRESTEQGLTGRR